MHQILRITSFFSFCLLSAFSCKSINNQNSQLNVTNGILSQSHEFKAVMLLITDSGQCSGVFVNDYQFLTAAHCVRDAKEVKVGEPRLGSPLFGHKVIAKAESWVIHPQFKSDADSSYDLAIVRFPRGTSTLGGLKINIQGVQLAQPIIIVGYGSNVIERQAQDGQIVQYGQGFKRWGSNKIEDKSGGLLRFLGALSEKDAERRNLKTGQRVLSAEGDSGGPMLNANSEIVGISSAAEPIIGSGQVLNYWSLYVDLSSESSRSFLQENGVLEINPNTSISQ